MTIIARCSKCRVYHRRGTKIWSKHKEYLGMYLDTATGSKARREPKHIKEYFKTYRGGK